MRRCAADAAAVKIDGDSSIEAREDDPAPKCIAAMAVDQTEFKQQIGMIAPDSQIAPEVSTWCVSHTQPANEILVAHTSGFEILKRFIVLIELPLIEGHCIAKHVIHRGGLNGTDFLFEVQNTVTKRQVQIKLDESDEIASAPAAMAEKEILVGVDVK